MKIIYINYKIIIFIMSYSINITNLHSLPKILNENTISIIKSYNYESKVKLLILLLDHPICLDNLHIFSYDYKRTLKILNIDFEQDPGYEPKNITIHDILLLAIRKHKIYFRIYPYEKAHIIHLIINHNLSFYRILNFCIYMYYWNRGSKHIQIKDFCINSLYDNITTICNTMTVDNIIFQYDYNYEKLLYDKCKGLMSNNDIQIEEITNKIKDNNNQIEDILNKFREYENIIFNSNVKIKKLENKINEFNKLLFIIIIIFVMICLIIFYSFYINIIYNYYYRLLYKINLYLIDKIKFIITNYYNNSNIIN
jgi:hypothetical protein